MLKIWMLSQFVVEVDGVRLEWTSRVAQSLFAYLALHMGKPIRREKLAGIFWPDQSERAARCQLRHALWRIRQIFAQQGLDSYLFLPEDALCITLCSPDWWIDVVELLRATHPKQPFEKLMADLHTYGEFLPGFNGPWDEWTSDWRRRIDHGFLCKGMCLLDQLVQAGCYYEALDWGMRLLQLDYDIDLVQHKLAEAVSGMGERWKIAACTCPALKAPLPQHEGQSS